MKDFYERINSDKSSKILSAINKFTNEVLNKNYASILDISTKVQSFITEVVNQFCALYSREVKYSLLYYEGCDGIESIITKALYNKVFSATKEEKEEDYEFDQRVRHFQFITLQHLDIDERLHDETYINFAIIKLNQINQYKTPKKKIKILIDFCNIISSMVCDNGGKGKIAGADEVFPIIVYALLKANTCKLKSNMHFIRNFRHKSRLESEDDYYFTTVSTAIEFIDNLTFTNLNITKVEFNAFLEESQKKDIVRKYNMSFTSTHRSSEESSILPSFKNKVVEPVEMKEIVTTTSKKSDDKSRGASIMLSETATRILKIDTEGLNRKYFNSGFQDLTLIDQQKLFNQFNEILKLVDDFKKENSDLIPSGIGDKAKSSSIFNSEELKSPFPGEKSLS